MHTQRKILLFACAGLLLVAHRGTAAALPEPGAKLIGLDGRPHTLRELRGHPAVVNFWATWCGPCREEMPLLQKMANAYAQRGVSFVAISIDDASSQEKIPALVAKRRFRIPVWTGASTGTLNELQMGVLVPATLVLDENGEVIGRIEGESRERDLRVRLDWLLGGRQGKPPKAVQKNDW